MGDRVKKELLANFNFTYSRILWESPKKEIKGVIHRYWKNMNHIIETHIKTLIKRHQKKKYTPSTKRYAKETEQASNTEQCFSNCL